MSKTVYIIPPASKESMISLKDAEERNMRQEEDIIHAMLDILYSKSHDQISFAFDMEDSATGELLISPNDVDIYSDILISCLMQNTGYIMHHIDRWVTESLLMMLEARWVDIHDEKVLSSYKYIPSYSRAMDTYNDVKRAYNSLPETAKEELEYFRLYDEDPLNEAVDYVAKGIIPEGMTEGEAIEKYSSEANKLNDINLVTIAMGIYMTDTETPVDKDMHSGVFGRLLKLYKGKIDDLNKDLTESLFNKHLGNMADIGKAVLIDRGEHKDSVLFELDMLSIKHQLKAFNKKESGIGRILFT